MIQVFRNDAERVQKRMLSKVEPDAMLRPICPVFSCVPFEVGH